MTSGIVRVALVGDSTIDVSTVNTESLTLVRADGVGGSVAPLADTLVPELAIADVTSTFGNDPCSCQILDGDGIDDLVVTFSVSDMTGILELDTIPRGESVELVLQGILQDHATFQATDCIVIHGIRHALPGLHRSDIPQ